MLWMKILGGIMVIIYFFFPANFKCLILATYQPPESYDGNWRRFEDVYTGKRH